MNLSNWRCRFRARPRGRAGRIRPGGKSRTTGLPLVLSTPVRRSRWRSTSMSKSPARPVVAQPGKILKQQNCDYE